MSEQPKTQLVQFYTQNGVPYVTAQLTEEQMKALKRNFIEDYSIGTERIVWQPGQGFVIEDHPERDTLSEQS